MRRAAQWPTQANTRTLNSRTRTSSRMASCAALANPSARSTTYRTSVPMTMIDGPGIYDIPLAEYLADPCPAPSLSASIAHILLSQSPRHAWEAHPRLNPHYEPEEAEAFDLGTAAHAYLLEGAEVFVTLP